MNDILCKRVDYSLARYRLGVTLDLSHARWLRGAVARRSARPEFHQHVGDCLVYQHPLIRYDVSTGEAVISGLAEGAALLRSLPIFDEFTLRGQTHQVLEHRLETDRIDLGPKPEPMTHTFQTPYLALNQENHRAWIRSSPAGRRGLLERVIIGNLLSLSKAIGLHVEERLLAEIDLEPDGWYELKPGLRLLGFRGRFRVNFALPQRWGIGKSSSRGFGTLIREEA
jgi:CRISPR-associated endoribonuclease Cas6